MCNAFQPHESFTICELVRQLGALYDKEKENGAADDNITWERRRISARLINMGARIESKRLCLLPSTRES